MYINQSYDVIVFKTLCCKIKQTCSLCYDLLHPDGDKCVRRKVSKRIDVFQQSHDLALLIFLLVWHDENVWDAVSENDHISKVYPIDRLDLKWGDGSWSFVFFKTGNKVYYYRLVHSEKNYHCNPRILNFKPSAHEKRRTLRFHWHNKFPSLYELSQIKIIAELRRVKRKIDETPLPELIRSQLKEKQERVLHWLPNLVLTCK